MTLLVTNRLHSFLDISDRFALSAAIAPHYELDSFAGSHVPKVFPEFFEKVQGLTCYNTGVLIMLSHSASKVSNSWQHHFISRLDIVQGRSQCGLNSRDALVHVLQRTDVSDPIIDNKCAFHGLVKIPNHAIQLPTTIRRKKTFNAATYISLCLIFI